MIFSLSLAHPPPPSLSPSPPPPPPPPLSLFPPDLILSSPFYSTHSVPLTCVLRSTLLLWQTPCYSFPLGSDTVFCHPVKPLIYCISQIGTLFIYILPFFFFSLCVSLSHFPSSSSYTRYLSIYAGAKNRLAADSCGTEVKAVSIREELVAQSSN